MSDQPQQQGDVRDIPMATPVFAPPPPMPTSTKKLGDDAGIRLLLPVGRSGWSIAAGYCGLFCLAVAPGPIAVIVSLIALADLRKHPEKRGRGRAVFGLIMGLLATVILAGLAIAWWGDFVKDVS